MYLYEGTASVYLYEGTASVYLYEGPASSPVSARDDLLRGLVRGRRHVFMPARATDPPCGHVRDALAAHRHLGCPRPGLVRV